MFNIKASHRRRQEVNLYVEIVAAEFNQNWKPQEETNI